MLLPARRFVVVSGALALLLGCGDPTSPPSDPDEPGPEAVGVEGGTATAENGAASLSVPANALLQPTVIVIDPSTLAALGDHVPAGEFDAAAGTVYGVRPIEGTIWDLQPDGLQFQSPATITLRYEESALPEGITEEDLGVFVINGIFEQLDATVDPAANTITAQIEHFSFAFTGPIPPPRLDLEVTDLAASPDPLPGEPLDLTAEVTNQGPGTAVTASVLYEVEGNVELGPVDASCEEVPTAGPGSVAVSCPLQTLAPSVSAAAAAVRVVPQQAGQTLVARATVLAGQGATEIDDANDTRELTVEVGGEGAVVDLKAGQPGLSPESDPRVGGLVGFVGRVDNLGAGTSSGGTMLMEAFGDVELGEVPTACTVIPASDPVAAAIQCPVDPLEPFGIDLQGPLWLTIPSAGEIRVVTTVTPSAVDTDPNLENNVGMTTIEVASTYLVDLEPVASPLIEGTRQAGEPLRFAVRIGNYLPPSNGGEVIYEAHGDVTLGEVAEGCAPVTGAPVVSVTCSFDAFVGYVNDTRGPQGERILGWVGPFEVIPQSDDLIIFTATTVPVEGDTDVNPDNDALEADLAIGLRTVDLSVVELLAPDSPIAGQAMDVVATLRNDGPDDSRGMAATLTVVGEFELGAFDESCVAAPLDLPIPAYELQCRPEPLPAGGESTLAFTITPQSAGLISLSARVRPSVNADSDRNATNDFVDVNVDVGPGG